uniref:HAT C-terminal dimerisation domain-containing protein n=1 Tax=Ditylenchus dipsaci TaxID=166011 RepID=A0A915ECW6_9BILA
MNPPVDHFAVDQFTIQIHQPESRETLPENKLLNSTLDQLIAEYAEELREKDERDAWLKQILQRVDAGPVVLLALEVLSVPFSGAPVERIFSQAG